MLSESNFLPIGAKYGVFGFIAVFNQKSLKNDVSDPTSQIENVDLVILHRSVRSMPRNSDFHFTGRRGDPPADDEEDEEELSSVQRAQAPVPGHPQRTRSRRSR